MRFRGDLGLRGLEVQGFGIFGVLLFIRSPSSLTPVVG